MNTAETSPPIAGHEQRPDAHPEQVVEGRRDRDAVPLGDVADVQDASRGGRGRQRAEDGQLTRIPGRDREREQDDGAGRGGERDACRPRRVPPGGATRADPVPQDDREQDGEHEDAVVARQRGDAREEPREHEVPRAALQAARREPQRAGDQRLVEREVVRLGHVHERQRRERRQDARAERDGVGCAGVAADLPGQRRRERTDQRERDGGGDRRGPEEPDERHLDDRCQGHPVGVGGDREDRVGGDRATDLGEDPDEVDVEPVARGELPGDVDVVVGIGVGGVGEEGGDGEPGHQCEQI